MKTSMWFAAGALCCAVVASPASAVPLIYDQTIVITDSQRAINIISHGGIGINPFVFQFNNTPTPSTSTIQITVFGEGDFDGLEDGGQFGAGFQETLAAGLDGINLAYNGSTLLGPFAGSRSFTLTDNFGWSVFNFADGLTGAIFLAQGVSANVPTDFLAMRITYTYDGMSVPLPATVWLFGLGLLGIGAVARWRPSTARRCGC